MKFITLFSCHFLPPWFISSVTLALASFTSLSLAHWFLSPTASGPQDGCHSARQCGTWQQPAEGEIGLFSWDSFYWLRASFLETPIARAWVICLCSRAKKAEKTSIQFSASILGGHFARTNVGGGGILSGRHPPVSAIPSPVLCFFNLTLQSARLNGFVCVCFTQRVERFLFYLGIPKLSTLASLCKGFENKVPKAQCLPRKEY